jgi:hypothetical protein
MFLTNLINTTAHLSSLFLVLDPLEQFDVLALPVFGSGLTNLSLLLGLNILIMTA